MRYIAYKIAVGNPNLPAGFVTQHFEVSTPTLDGYLVAPLEAFNAIFQNNITLYRNMEAANGVTPADPNAAPPAQRAASEAQPVPQAVVDAADQLAKKNATQSANNVALFTEFMAWKAAKGS